MNRPGLARQFHPDRRTYGRYRLPLPLTVTARWTGQVQLLERASTLENISASGLYFSLSAEAAGNLPENAELEVTLPLVEPAFHPVRVYARCRARVVRRDALHGVAAEFADVQFIREERPTGLPVPLPP